MTISPRVTLGKTGLEVGRLGIASSYGAPAAAFEEAFERGCNYFTWGSFVRGRSKTMKEAIRAIIARGKREELVLAMVTYAHSAFLTERFLRRGLKTLGTDYADVLLLGYYSKPPPARVLSGARKLKEAGLIRHVGITSHNRKYLAQLRNDALTDVLHVRYNAAHRGAEVETFPQLEGGQRPGVVAVTATRWGKLLDAKRMPPGQPPPSAADCYRFALSSPSVDICMVGARSLQQMRENLSALEQPAMSEAELARMRRIGDWVYGKREPRAASGEPSAPDR